ncbi:thiol-disulfide oxidoreductase [Pontibacillus litoralis JSM 072002]|uniref:Thiol-disulfide oxidoreductase n=2 Tax=Pontibacillus TaxID=289201 RepID=A0A0A5G4A2_9BACI|nr:thiol-disulfide oxidoreductase [Pontibacillus litoralis JSM 072002]
MDKKKKRLIFRSVLLTIMVLMTVYAVYTNLTSDKKAVLQVGDEAPNFELPTMNINNKETLKLEDYKGQGVMLNFWATYCGPCKEEMPYMQQLYPAYKEKGVEIIAINLDKSKLVVEQFLDEYGLTFPVVQDTTSEVMQLYDVGALPASYFVGPDGKIEHKIIGALTLENLEGYLQDITPES